MFLSIIDNRPFHRFIIFHICDEVLSSSTDTTSHELKLRENISQLLNLSFAAFLHQNIGHSFKLFMNTQQWIADRTFSIVSFESFGKPLFFFIYLKNDIFRMLHCPLNF